MVPWGTQASWKKAKTSALMEREGGTRKGSPFTQPPPCAGGRTEKRKGFFIGAMGSASSWKKAKTSALMEREGETRKGSPFTQPPPCAGGRTEKTEVFFIGAMGNASSWKKAKTSALMEREGKTRKSPMVLPYCRFPEKPLIFRPDPPKALN